MKNYIIHVALAFILFNMISCERYSLEIAPVSSVADGNFWQNEGQVEAFLTGIHSRLRTHSYTLFQLGTLRADEFGDEPFGGESMGGLERLFLNTLNEENPVIGSYGNLYTNINQINLFISRVESLDFIDENFKHYSLGQAYGLRAFYYFHLVRSWGDVVLYTEASTSFDISNLDRPASSQVDILSLIKSDLQKSESYFQNNYSFLKNKKCYWSKSASLLLKADVYIWTSKRLNGGVDDAEIAISALEDIKMNVSELGLESSYIRVFDYDNKDNNEIIFSIRNELQEHLLFGGAIESMLPQVTYIGLLYDSLQNRLIDKETDIVQVVGRGLTTAIRISTFRKYDDLDYRKFEAIQGVYSFDNDKYELEGCYLKKYRGTIDGGNRVFVDDFPIYRYADLLLLLAEAKVIIGDDPTNEINEIRRRAYSDNYDVDRFGFPNMPGDDDINEVLLNERLLEFIGEGKRWYDLRRFGSEYVLKHTTLDDANRILWPVDLPTLSRNKLLTQTNGY